MTKQQIIIGAIVLVAFAGLLGYAFKDTPAVQTITNTVEKEVGALAGPMIPYDYMCWGEVCHYYYSMPLSTSTTTPCHFKAPQTGTSTLVFSSITFSTASTAAMYIGVGKSTSPIATTTTIGDATTIIGANDTGTIVASTTPFGSEKTIFSKNDYLVYHAYRTGLPLLTFSPVGHCVAEFIVNQR